MSFGSSRRCPKNARDHDDRRKQAIALKFRPLSIRLTSEVFDTNRNMSANAIFAR
jgi:hypothetical protein